MDNFACAGGGEAGGGVARLVGNQSRGRQMHELLKQLGAAKQRELELLAVIENTRLALSDGHELNMSNYSEDEVRDLNYAWTNAALEIEKEPSQALREHEAKMLDEVFKIAELFPDDGLETANRIRRMAEERRNK